MPAVTDEMIEAGCKARHGRSWKRVSEKPDMVAWANSHRSEMRMILEAALSASPVGPSFNYEPVQEYADKHKLNYNELCSLVRQSVVHASPVGAEEIARALKPFADFADPRRVMPRDLVITSGSMVAKRQLTMGECYDADAALSALERRTHNAK